MTRSSQTENTTARATQTQAGFAGLVKGCFDVVGAAGLLVVLSPLLALIALLVRMTMGTPVLFRQQRPGRHAEIFELLKFRTMTNTRDEKGRLMPDDARMTGLGKWLRSSSLDESPQLWNVLRGELSFVGPRPLLVEYLPRYTPQQARRHAVKPGITGWAQVNGRNAISWEEKFALDTWYVEHWSLWLDMKILALTLWRVVTRHGISQQGRATMEEFRGKEDERLAAQRGAQRGLMAKNNVQTPLTVLISSIGRRSQLVSCFRQAFEKLAIKGRIIGCDSNPAHAPAGYLVDECFKVPRCTDPSFVERVLALAQKENVALIVPTIDPELPLYAASREQFREEGIEVAVSGPQTVQIAGDKAETNRWLRARGIPTVRQAGQQQVLNNIEDWSMPVIVKPRRGSASIGVMKVTSPEMLRTALESDSELVVEEFAAGQEHTINVFVNANGRCVCVVPHRRIETRGGEVSKGVTVKNRALMDVGKRISEALPRAFGALNIQCFLRDSGDLRVTEINARFGGGFPLANEAGAVFPAWLLQSILGLETPERYDCWTDRLVMLRYDSAVFFKEQAL